MKRMPTATLALSGALVVMLGSTELPARDKSGQGASVGAGGASVSAGPGGASVSAGGASVSAGRSGASVTAGSAGGAGDRNDTSAGARGAPTAVASRPVGERSYDSLGEWFDDLRSSWFGGRKKDSDAVTTTRSATTQETATSDSGRTQVNRVTQTKTSTAVATEGGSAAAQADNINVTEQKN